MVGLVRISKLYFVNFSLQNLQKKKNSSALKPNWLPFWAKINNTLATFNPSHLVTLTASLLS